MITLQNLSDALRGHRKAIELDDNAKHIKLVRELAAGKEVDESEIVALIERMGITTQDFLADCDKYGERKPDKEQLKRRVEIRQQIPQLKSELDRAAAVLQAAVDKYQPAVNEAAQRYRDAEQEAITISHYENRLRSSCIDRSIISRMAFLNESRKDISTKLAPILNDLNRMSGSTDYYRRRVDIIRQAGKKLDRSDLPGRTKNRADLDAAKIALSQHLEGVGRLEAMVAELQTKMTPIDRELKELDAAAIAS